MTPIERIERNLRTARRALWFSRIFTALLSGWWVFIFMQPVKMTHGRALQIAGFTVAFLGQLSCISRMKRSVAAIREIRDRMVRLEHIL